MYNLSYNASPDSGSTQFLSNSKPVLFFLCVLGLEPGHLHVAAQRCFFLAYFTSSGFLGEAAAALSSYQCCTVKD